MKTKNQGNVLDDLDWRILQVLQEDAKQTYVETGRRLRVAHSTVHERIKKMEEQGIIEKYTAILNLEKTEAKCIMAIMTVFTDPKESEKVAERLSKFEEVLEVFTSLSEELLIIAKIVAEDQEKLHSFIAHSVAPLPGVLRVRTSIVAKKHKDEMFFIKRVRTLNESP